MIPDLAILRGRRVCARRSVRGPRPPRAPCPAPSPGTSSGRLTKPIGVSLPASSERVRPCCSLDGIARPRVALGRNADLRSAVSQTSSLRAVRRSPAAETEPERLAAMPFGNSKQDMLCQANNRNPFQFGRRLPLLTPALSPRERAGVRRGRSRNLPARPGAEISPSSAGGPGWGSGRRRRPGLSGTGRNGAVWHRRVSSTGKRRARAGPARS